MVLTRAWEQRMSRMEERMEELFDELYASSKQHDSRQRYAMIVELRALMKQPIRGNSGSDHFERALDDEDLVETEIATELIGIEDETVKREANAEVISANVKKEQIPQIQVPISKLEHGLQIHNVSSTVCEDYQYVVGCDELCEHQGSILEVSHVRERNVLVTESTSVTINREAHQLFDKMPSKEKCMKHLKAWKFKFKSTSKRSRLKDSKFSFVDATVLLNKDSLETIWDCVKKEFEETMAACEKNIVDRFKLAEEKESRLQLLDLNQTFMYHQIGQGDKERLGIKKKRKGFKSWMFKYKKGNKKRDLLLLNGKDSLAVRAIGTGLETVERDSSNQEKSKLCTEDKGELKGCLERLQASVLLKEESESMVLNEVKAEFKTFDRKRSDRTLSLEDKQDDEHEQNQVIKLISSLKNRIWEPGGVLIEHDRWKELEKRYKPGRLMRLLSSMWWQLSKSRELERLGACSFVDIKTWLDLCSREYKNHMLLLDYHGIEMQVLSCLLEIGFRASMSMESGAKLWWFDQCGGLNVTVIAGTIMQTSLKSFHHLRVACLHHTSLGFLYGSLPRPPEENHSNFSNMPLYHETWSCISLRTNRVWDPGGSNSETD